MGRDYIGFGVCYPAPQPWSRRRSRRLHCGTHPQPPEAEPEPVLCSASALSSPKHLQGRIFQVEGLGFGVCHCAPHPWSRSGSRHTKEPEARPNTVTRRALSPSPPESFAVPARVVRLVQARACFARQSLSSPPRVGGSSACDSQCF